MIPSRILVSSLIASAGAAHGGPVVSRRQAAALVRRGFDVCVAAPSGERREGDPFEVEIFPTGVKPRDRLGPRCHDATAVDALRKLIDRFKPDIVYDVHGSPWAVEAASRAGIPVVSMMGDYNWFCANCFLVNSRVQRCTGPDSREKCFRCVNKWHRREVRPIYAVLRPAAAMGLAPLPLWTRLGESMQYMADMRSRITKFVVGDRKAHEFLIDHGVDASKIARIVQGLPAEALQLRRPAQRAQRAQPEARRLRMAFVGRTDPDKGLRVLARAFDSLPPSLPVDLWVVHTREARADYVRHLFPSRQRFARDLKSGRLRLLRPASQADVFELMAQADFGVVPSIAFESPCLAMLEFVAQRTPIVRSESAGMEHVIQDGVNGRTFPYGDWRALANVIHEIAADRAVLERWRERLPRIRTDDEYARDLDEVFGTVAGRRETTRTLEECHA